MDDRPNEGRNAFEIGVGVDENLESQKGVLSLCRINHNHQF